MHHKRHLYLTTGTLAALLAIGVGGCAAPTESDEAAADRQPQLLEDVGTTVQAATVCTNQTCPKTIPATGLGFTLLNNSLYQVKNGKQLCMWRDGNVIKAAACSSDAVQLWAIYVMPGGTYNLCAPRSLAFVDEIYPDDWPTDDWSAQCVAVKPFSSTDVRIQGVDLATRPWNSTGAFTAQSGLIRESGGRLSIGSKYLVPNSSNVVVLGNLSTSTDQVWSVQ